MHSLLSFFFLTAKYCFNLCYHLIPKGLLTILWLTVMNLMIMYSLLILVSSHRRAKITTLYLWLYFQFYCLSLSYSFLQFYCFFYPIKIFLRLLSKCMHSRLLIFLNIFIEKFHCSYRDGLDGTKDMRSFSGTYFLLRMIIYYAVILISRRIFNLDYQLTRGLVFSAAILLIALSRPYKKTYMNIMDSILLSHMATLCFIIASTSTSALKDEPQLLLLIHVLIALPFIISIFLMAFRVTHGIFKQHMPSIQCLACLKVLRMKRCDNFISQDLESPETTTYGTINF